MSSEDRRLSIEEFVSEKFYGGRKAPRFVVWILRKVLREDFLNYLLENTTGEGPDFCSQVLDLLYIKLEVEGLENVPIDGSRYAFASNHPLGAIDGMALCHLIGHSFGGVKMLVNDFIMLMKPLRPICVPVNKLGGQARSLNLLVNEVFAGDEQLYIFPAGVCSRRIKGVVQDLPWQKTFIRKSVENGRKVVPVHFIGENSKRFYTIANLNKVLGIKFNFAMLFLFDEVYRSKGKSYKIVFGEPLEPSFFDNSKTAIQWADWMRTKIYTL